MSVIKRNCAHYVSDRPCRPHKRHGYTCGDCPEYDPRDHRVLIVKLDAIGDVLRTTSILQPLHAAFPGSHVTWLTKANAAAVLQNIPLIDHVLTLEDNALLHLLTSRFDLVINPDTSSTACRLASVAQGHEKRGFFLSSDGAIHPTNAVAENWYRMGLDDQAKRRNQRTYQSLLLDICGLPATAHPILWRISDSERAFAGEFAARAGLQLAHRKIGINAGASGRWRWKKWTADHQEVFIRGWLARHPNDIVLLYGGPEETAVNRHLSALDLKRVVDTGTANSLRQFGALVDLCDILVTGDTLALHVGIALEKPVVALFGPTSSAEIELYGRGIKILPPDMPCLCCYLDDCTVRPACMQRILPEMVQAACQQLLPTPAGG